MINEQEVKAPTLINSAIKWGIINGAAGIVIIILFYIIDYTWLVSFKLLGVALVIGIGIIIYGGIDYRNQVGGYLSYGKAWQHGFFMLAISGLIGTIFNLVLYNLVDSELPAKLTDTAVENARAMMESFGMQEGPDMDKAIAQAETDTAARFTPFGMAKGYIFQLVFSAIFALITAIFVKKNPPVDQI